VIPLHDDNPTRSTPVITHLLIAANVLVFLWQQTLGGEVVTYRFGLFPFLITGAEPAATRLALRYAALAHEYNLQPAWATLVTSMFLHGSWMHLIGNMLFLAIFGNNIEDELGKVRFLIFYLVCGAAAGAAQVLIGWNSTIPTIGASGAIAGVLGAYYLLFPRARVTCLIIFFFITVMDLPASLVLGFWFVLQVVEGLFGLGQLQKGLGGIAFAAHIGGFLVGYVLMKLMRPARPSRPRYYLRPDVDWR
jgi:membrane associated rhomboid family serine protease